MVNQLGKRIKREKDKSLHINILKLIAAKFAIMTFTKRLSNIAIHLQIDCTFISFEESYCI